MDCIAPDLSAIYTVDTLEKISIQSCYIIHSIDCHSVFCVVLERVHWQLRKVSGREYTRHCRPIVYPAWVSGNSIMSTDEGELIRTVPSLELQGDIEGSCDMERTMYKQCTK